MHPPGSRPGLLAEASGLTSIDQAEVETDKKGDFYVAIIEKAGRPAIEVIGEILPEIVGKPSRGRSRCVGACDPRHPARSAGCGRSIPSRGDLRTGDRGAADRRVPGRRHRFRQCHPRAPLPRARAVRGASPRRLCGQARQGEGRARRGTANGDDPHGCREYGLRPGLRADGGPGACWRRWLVWSNGRSC